MEDSINFLSFLIVILIAVIVSPRAKKAVGKIIDFSMNALKYLFIIILVGLLVGLLIGGIWMGLVWVWQHRAEISQVIFGLFLVGIVYAIIYTIGFHLQIIDRNSHSRRMFRREIVIFSFIFLIGFFVWLREENNPFMSAIGIKMMWLAYPSLLAIRFIVWLLRQRIIKGLSIKKSIEYKLKEICCFLEENVKKQSVK